MNADTWIGPAGNAFAGKTRTLDLRETIGGYVVSGAKGGFDTDLLAEATLKFFGLSMMLASGALWLVPEAVFRGDVLILKLAMTAGFLSTGLALYWYANRGFADEVQVDTVRREVRLASRNTRDTARTNRRIAMRDIESSFIRRSTDGGASQLFLRLRGSSQPLQILRAPESDLAVVHARLARDMRAPKERIAARAA